MFAWASLDAPELATRVLDARAVDVVRRGIGAAPVVTFLGPAGIGKTSLACALARALALRGEFPERGEFLFVTALELVAARAGHPLGRGEAPLVAAALGADLVILDDLGAEDGRSTGGAALAELIHARHAGLRRTLVTTGFGPDDLTARYGAGVKRRLLDGCAIKLEPQAGQRRPRP